jgi:hypothetical protein
MLTPKAVAQMFNKTTRWAIKHFRDRLGVLNLAAPGKRLDLRIPLSLVKRWKADHLRGRR